MDAIDKERAMRVFRGREIFNTGFTVSTHTHTTTLSLRGVLDIASIPCRATEWGLLVKREEVRATIVTGRGRKRV